MTQPFVSQLRARGAAIHVGEPGASSITVRIEVPEIWDTVKAVAVLSTSVAEVKAKALEVLLPFGAPADFVMKLRGWEVLDEGVSLDGAGALDGSIFLLTHRRRRAVR